MSERGDTIVEVMLATAVLSLVLAGAFTTSNRATRINQTASERTQVSNYMQREAELLRASVMRDPVSFWNAIDANGLESGENIDYCFSATPAGPNPAPSAFHMEDDLSVAAITTSAPMDDAVPGDLFNIWVEAVDGPPGAAYTDFFIYACWEGIGGEGLLQSGLVQRLVR